MSQQAISIAFIQNTSHAVENISKVKKWVAYLVVKK
jgi:hypothetical protein